MLNPKPPKTVGELPERLQYFLRERGAAKGTPVVALKDGGNNQVYRVPGGTQDYVLKHYFQHPTDARDRFNTERVFYDFLWNCGVRQIAEPCVWDAENRLGLFTFIAGRKLNPGEITAEAVEQAQQFIVRINSFRKQPGAEAIPAASEAFFSIAEQLEGIGNRVAMLQQIEGRTEMDAQARTFVQKELLPVWAEILAAINRQARGNPELKQTLAQEKRCLSPSDFGFHNALLAEGAQLHFIDFEYAGWDDPAKLVCDFFCQPQVPVAFGFWDVFIKAFADDVGGESSLPLRARLLLPAYQIKWCCIILNHFVKGGKARREFARGAASEEAKATQLEKARRLFQRSVSARNDFSR